MTNSPKIQSIVQEFITRLSEALAEESTAAIRAALSGDSGAPAPRASSRAAAAPSNGRSQAASRGRAKGAKRSPEELENQTKALLAFVRKNPGERIETIGKSLSIPTKDLALPVAKLLESKAISKKGQRRATTYYPK